MQFIFDTIIQLVINGGLLSIIAYLIKKYFDKKMDNLFALKVEEIKHSYSIELENIKSKLASNVAATSKIIEKRIESYQELGSVIYKCRNLLRDIISENEREEIIESYHQYCEQTNKLKELLFNLRIVLSENSFDTIHEYKNISVKYSLALDLELINKDDISKDRINNLINYSQYDLIHKKCLSIIKNDFGGIYGNQ